MPRPRSPRGWTPSSRAVPAIDPTLEGAARSTLGKIQHDMQALRGKILQAAKRRDETLRRQFTSVRTQAFPDGAPQERASRLRRVPQQVRSGARRAPGRGAAARQRHALDSHGLTTMPPGPAGRPADAARPDGSAGSIIRIPRKAWLVVGGVAVVCALIGIGVASYYWVLLGRQIDLRLHGERERVLPRVYARPLELYKGQALGQRQLIDRLNDLGYARTRARSSARRVRDRPRRHRADPARRRSQGRRRPRRLRSGEAGERRLPAAGRPRQPADGRTTARVQHVTLDPPLLTALISASREKRRQVPLVRDSAAHGAGGAGHRGPPLLRPPRRRSDSHRSAR